jgi:signal transduction histidine kinase
MGDAAGLQELFDQAAAAGMDLTITTVGEPRALGSGAALTLHRACQEALTNVRKHAGPGARVEVNLTWTEGGVALTVADDGRGGASNPGNPGFGLIGLRERAALVEGTLESAPRPGGGWQTKLTMPT